jgi:hypothetical protein
MFTKLPDVPVIVTVPAPAAAVLLAASVNVVVLVVLLGLKEMVTPLGRPVAEKLTLPLKPFCGMTVIVLVPLAPCAIVRLVGDAESAKFATAIAFTVSETEVVFDKMPDVPVIVTEDMPVAAVPLAVSVNVLPLVAPLGLKDAVTPIGRPVADKLTPPLKPFWGMMVIVLVPLVPCVTVTLLGDAESEKFGCGGTGVVMETLSKVAATRAVALPLVTAKPTYVL